MLFIQIFILFQTSIAIPIKSKSIRLDNSAGNLSSKKNFLASASVPFVREAGMMIISTDGINFSKHWNKFLTNGNNPDGTWTYAPSSNNDLPSGNFTFIGTQFYLVANQSPDFAKIKFQADDLMAKSIDLSNTGSKVLNQTFTVYKNDFDFTSHTVQIRVQAASNKKVEIVCFLIRPYPLDRGSFIEAPDMTYDPELWELKSENTQLHSKSSKSTVKVEFVGNQFYYYGTLDENYGSVSFILDGKKIGETSHKGKFRYNSLLFTSEILLYSYHKLEIEMNDDGPVEIGTFYYLRPDSSETPIPINTKEFSKSVLFSNRDHFTQSHLFSNSKVFSETDKFSLSQKFSESFKFSQSEKFSQSNEFIPSNKFTKSDDFSKSKVFLATNKFTPSEKFSQSMKFSQSNKFIQSNKFTKSDDFSKSKVFLATNKFTPSEMFSQSAKFSKSNEFIPSSMFTKSDEFISSSKFIKSDDFSRSKVFLPTIKFTSSDKFTESEKSIKYESLTEESDLQSLISSKLSQSNQFSNSKTHQFKETFSFSATNKYTKREEFSSQSFPSQKTDNDIQETITQIITMLKLIQKLSLLINLK